MFIVSIKLSIIVCNKINWISPTTQGIPRIKRKKPLRIMRPKSFNKNLTIYNKYYYFIIQTVLILTLHNFTHFLTKQHGHLLGELRLLYVDVRSEIVMYNAGDSRSQTRQCDYDYGTLFFYPTKREGGSQVVELMSVRSMPA